MRLTEWLIRFLFKKGVGKLLIVIWNFSSEAFEVFSRNLACRTLSVKKDYIIITVAGNTDWRIGKVSKQGRPRSEVNLLGGLLPCDSFRLTLSEKKILGLFRYVGLSNTRTSHEPEDNTKDVGYLFILSKWRAHQIEC